MLKYKLKSNIVEAITFDDLVEYGINSGGIYPDKKNKYDLVEEIYESLNDECGWNKGKMYHCNKFDGQMIYETGRHKNNSIDVKKCKCLHCHGYMQKPEPESLVIESEGTYVAYWKEIDYLWTGEACIEPPKLFYSNCEKQIVKGWASFTGDNPDIVELTPEISKLWPKVEIELGQFSGGFIDDTLVMVSDKGFVCAESGSWRKDTNIRLLTAKELPKPKKKQMKLLKDKE